MMKEVDEDNSGAIDFAEFCRLMQTRLPDCDSAEEHAEVFAMFNRSGSGVINETELSDMMQQLGVKLTEKELRTMMRVASRTEGGVNLSDFVRVISLQKKCLS